MCEFCEDFKSGRGDATVSMKESNIDFGVFGNGNIEIEMSEYLGTKKISAWIYFSAVGKAECASIEIRYCPICGRKLAEEYPMNKQELLSTYTAEQLADMVVEYEIVKKQYEISTNWEKTMPEHELKAKFNQETAKIKYENERLKTTINQIDEILEELFGVKHDAVEYGEFEQLLREKVTEKVADSLPTEPIKVADMLISATHTREKTLIEKTFSKAAFGNNDDTIAENMYSVSELRQIADHLLVYCNANGEAEE